MTTQSEDLLKKYADNQSHIQHIRGNIKRKAESLSKLGEILGSDPEALSKPSSFSVSGDGNFLIGSDPEVSCGLLKELAKEIMKLQELRDEEYALKGRIEREGLGRYIRD